MIDASANSTISLDTKEIGATALVSIRRAFPNGIKRILLVMPPDMISEQFEFAAGKRGRYRNYPPYGPSLLAAHLRRDDIDVSILNLNHAVLRGCHEAESESSFDFEKVIEDEIETAVSDIHPDLIGITCMFSQTHASLMRVVKKLRAAEPGVPFAAGGVHITNSLANLITATKLLDDLPEIDFFFQFESDVSFRNFVRVANGVADASDLAQYVFRVEGTVKSITRRQVPQGDDLNQIAAHDLLKTKELTNYGNVGSFYCHKPNGTRFTTVLSNRGCRAQCTFCSVRNFNGVGVRRRNVESVIEELKILKYEHGVEHIVWLDDDFLYDRAESIRLFNEMVKHDIRITFDCSNGVIAASCTEEVMSAATDAGCIGLLIGMESGSRRILREVKKPGTVETFLKASEVLRRFEQIDARVFLMIGFPNETYREIFETITVAHELGLDWYNVAVLQPLPNTPIFDSMLDEGLIEPDFDKIRWNTGSIGIGKVSKFGGAPHDLQACDFKDAFNLRNMDRIPERGELDDIWAYMNFHLNFNKLMFENRERKLIQRLAYIESLCDLIVPENVFAMYCLGYLQMRVHGAVSHATTDRLRQKLAQMPYWQNRFDEFGWSVRHLEEGVFPDRIDYVTAAHAELL